MRAIWIPKEHGAWAMLLAAIALAWAVPGVRGLPAAVLTVLFLLGFAIQEPLRVIAGGRGGRAAVLWTVAYGLLLLGGAAWLVARSQVYVLVPLACAGMGLTAADLVLRRKGHHRNVLVRLVGAACLTLVLPAIVSVAHPGWVGYAFVAWGLTLAYFATRLVAIRARIEARWRGRAAAAWRDVVLASQAALYAVLVPLVAGGVVSAWILLAYVPGSVAALRRPGEGTIRAAGFAEIPHLVWFVVAVIGTYHLR